MSGMQVPIGTTAQDRTNLFGSVGVSFWSQGLLAAALVVAWYSGDQTALTLLIGCVATNATTVINFWVGSSSGSRAKDAKIPAAPTA